MRVNIWIPDDLVDGIRSEAKKSERSVSGYLVWLHRLYVTREVIVPKVEDHISDMLSIDRVGASLIDSPKRQGILKNITEPVSPGEPVKLSNAEKGAKKAAERAIKKASESREGWGGGYSKSRQLGKGGKK